MKKIMIVLALIAAGVQAKYLWVGAGTTVSATTTPQVVAVSTNSSDYAYSCSVQNLGSETVYVQLGTSTNGFVASEAVPVNGVPFSFSLNNEDKSRQIYGVIVATTNETASVNVAFN